MQRLFTWIRGLGLGTKITLIIAVLMLPIGHLALLFAGQANKDISFARQEMAGSRATVAIWEGLVAAARPHPSMEVLRLAGEHVTALGRGEAATLGVTAPVDAFGKALSQARPEALSLGAAAMQKLADASNLTLDPDVDSFYMMDVATVRLVDFLQARVALDKAMLPFREAAGRPSLAAFDALVEASAIFDTTLAAVLSSARSGLGGNADGSVGRVLEKPLADFAAGAAATAKIAHDIRSGMAGASFGPQATAGYEAASSAVEGLTETLWQGAHGELSRLLGQRVAGFWQKIMVDLAIAAAGLLLAIAVAAGFIRSIRKPLADVIATLRRFQQNDFSGAVPHIDLRNEIGEVARALDRGKHDAERTALTVSAMNQSPTMMMITDPEEKISFISASLITLLMRLEPAFRAARHDFSVEKMTGEHLDYYRANPALRRTLILDNGSVRKVRYDVGEEVILVDMAYIYGLDGQKIGHTLVWRDVTAELLGQAEVAGVVQAAQQGDFSGRLMLDNKEGFVREVAIGLNNVSELVERATADFADVLQAVAQGDLTRSVGNQYAGVLGRMQQGIDETVSRLAETIATIQTTSTEVAGAAQEINSGARDLAARTEDQASSLEETAATTEELAASVKTSARASRDAVTMAENAMQVAENGGGIVRNAVEAMARIEQASRRIADISSVIDGIAFQTNLLALNAAVEAARAGEAGRGFAVVAGEVRTLAQRSSDAAKDIAQLIGSSTAEIGEGVTLVRSAGDVLGQIVEASRRVSETVTDIATAAGEQANGIEEMSQVVAHMDEMTQQNAALAEESAASALALDTRIQGLNRLVARFRIAGKAEIVPEQARITALHASRPGLLRRTA